MARHEEGNLRNSFEEKLFGHDLPENIILPHGQNISPNQPMVANFGGVQMEQPEQITEEQKELSPRSAFKRARDQSLKELGESFVSQQISDNL